MNPVNLANLGRWLFQRRTWLPLPVIAALLLIPEKPFQTPASVWAGVVVVVAGEMLRLWAVHHIGVISRTRSERLGPLVTSGPFSSVRNPLYIGNLALWIGFTIAASINWLLPIVIVLLAFEYHAIVRWEEQLLESRIGDPYRDYLRRVPRWIPGLPARTAPTVDPGSQTRRSAEGARAVRFSWRETFFSERGTLVAIAAGYFLLWVKAFVLM